VESAVRSDGTYLEDLAVGQELVTPAHTVTESELEAFARLSGDHNPLHTDPVFAASGPYGRRIAHGLLVASIVSGLTVQLGGLDDTILGFRRLEWKFRQPVFLGDTVHARLTVTRVRAVQHMGGGLVDLNVRVYNQRGENVQSGTWSILVRSRDDER